MCSIARYNRILTNAYSGLYAGVSPSVVGSVGAWSLYMMLYEKFDADFMLDTYFHYHTVTHWEGGN